MAIATVVKVVFGVKMKDKWDGAELHSQTANGQKRKDFIFKKAEQYQVLTKLEAGDEVELKLEKNGQYYNLKDIIPTGGKSAGASSGGGSSSTPAAGAGKAAGGWVPRFSDTEAYITKRDTSIIRQCSLKAAVDIVAAMLHKDMYKKSATPDFIAEEIGRLANKFENQVTGEGAMDKLAASCESLDTSGGVTYDDDCPPFDVD